MTDQTLARLRELLLNEFSESELEQLCSDLGLRYADLRGTGAFGKTRELLETARAQDKLRQLQNRVRELRPSAFAAAGLGTVGAVSTVGAVGASTVTSPVAADGAKVTVPTSTTELPARTIGSVAPATTSAPKTDAPAPSATRERAAAPLTSARLLPIVAIALVVVLCVAAAASLILNRPSLPAANATVSANATSAQATPAVVVSQVIPTQAPQGAATSAVSGDGTVLTTTVAAEGTAAAATEAATTTPEPSPTTAPSATPQATVTPDPTTAASQAHPAALVIRDLNQQLPEFYLGKVTATDLQKYWTGPAWTSVVNFGTTKLPRVMRIPTAQRGNLDITYRYEQAPALQSERGSNAVVVAREYWRYANAANAIEICETRQYTYNLVKDGDVYKVREFTSRLLTSGCN